MIDLRSLRYFVTLSEELHFGRAADRLGMTQPPLSQAIKRLESTLGVALFERSSRSVKLTPAGNVFAQEARKALDQVEFAERMVRRTAQGSCTHVTVGLIEPALFRILPAALEVFRARMPGIEVRLAEVSLSSRQIEKVRDGSIDIGMVSPQHPDLDGLSRLVVERCGSVLAVPADWPIARRDTIRLSDLAGVPVITFPYERSPAIRAHFFDACRDAGFTPNITQEATHAYTTLNLVAAGFGVAIMMETAKFTEHRDVRFIPITGIPEALSWELSIVWVPAKLNVPTRVLIESFETAAQRIAGADSNGDEATP